MKRMILAMGLSLLAAGTLARADDTLEKKQAQEIEKKLAQKITVDFESGPLKDALEWISERYKIPITVNAKAFAKELKIPDVRNQPVRLNKTGKVPMSKVLHELLDQVEGTYRIKGKKLVVVPKSNGTS